MKVKRQEIIYFGMVLLLLSPFVFSAGCAAIAETQGSTRTEESAETVSPFSSEGLLQENAVVEPSTTIPEKEDKEREAIESSGTIVKETQVSSEKLKTEKTEESQEVQEKDTSDKKIFDRPLQTGQSGDFTVSGNENGYEYTDHQLIFKESGSYTVFGKTTVDRIVVQAQNVTLTLNGLDIDISTNKSQAAILIDLNASATIQLVGRNRLKSGNRCAGLQNNNTIENSLIITSGAGNYDGFAGELAATGGNYGAGIGGKFGVKSTVTIAGGSIIALGGEASSGIGCGGGTSGSSTVIINGGTITATGGLHGSGIGAGSRCQSTVTINGGKITAFGGEMGTGIGSGYDNWAKSKVIINGWTVTAQGNNSAPGIGKGPVGTSTVVIDGGSVKALSSANTVDSLDPRPKNSSEGDLALCSLINYQASGKIAVDGVDYMVGPDSHPADSKYYLYLTKENHVVTLEKDGVSKKFFIQWVDNQFVLCDLTVDETEGVTYQDDSLSLGGDNKTYHIKMQPGINETKKDKLKVTGKNVTVYLNNVKIDVSSNTDQTACLIDTNASATIQLVGENSLKSGLNCAGLQNNSTIENSLVLTSEFDEHNKYTGRLLATGGTYGAGIGSGKQTAGRVNVTGGTITAIGGEYSAGIGSGYLGNCTVSISAGTITATGGTAGAGIAATKAPIIDGGSIKAVSIATTSIIPPPKNSKGNEVALYLADASSHTAGELVKIGTTDYKVAGKHQDDEKFYLYAPKEKHVVTVGDTEDYIDWKSDKFVPASTYTLSVPAKAELDNSSGDNGKVGLTNEFYSIPGYTRSVSVGISTATEQVDQNLVLKNQKQEDLVVHSRMTFTTFTLKFDDQEQKSDLTLGKPEPAEGNIPIRAGSYRGRIIFEANME